MNPDDIDTELEGDLEEELEDVIDKETDFYVPTLREIAEGCLEIQKTWDEDTRVSRIADPALRPSYTFHWEVPVIKLEDLGAEAEGALQDVVDMGEVYAEQSYAIDVIPDSKSGQRILPNIDRVKIV